MAKVCLLPYINLTLLFWLPKSKLPTTESAISGKLQNQSCKQHRAFWRADIYPVITKIFCKSSVPMMHPQHTYPTRDGTHPGTNCRAQSQRPAPAPEPKHSLPPAQLSSCSRSKTFVGCVRDDESIEFDYKINIEECAH